MAVTGIFSSVVLVRSDVSEERIAFISRLTTHGDQGTTIVITNNVVLSSPIRVTLMMEVILHSETSIGIKTTLRNIQEDAVLRNMLCST
jgi:hypothetical protein